MEWFIKQNSTLPILQVEISKNGRSDFNFNQNLNGINKMKLKKGSAAAKAFMAKIRAKKGTTKKVPAKKTITGYKKGSTRFIEKGEKPYKTLKTVQVKRRITTEPKGSFKKFRTVSGIGIMNGVNDVKKLKELAAQSKSPLVKKVASIIASKKRNGGYDTLQSVFQDISYGLQSGVISELIYYSDTIKWFKKYNTEISRMLRNSMEDMGVDSLSDLFGKNWDTTDPFANDTQNQNLLAWYSFEETARNLSYSLGYEI